MKKEVTVINKIDKIVVNIETDPNMTLWHAIKLRIASHKKIAMLIQESFDKTLQYTDAIDEQEHIIEQGQIH